MALLRLLCFAALVPALAAVLGALLASPLGERTAFVVATITGTIGVLLMIHWARRLGWLHPDRGRGAAIGGLVGLGLGAPLAAMTPDRPLALVVAALLVGIGAVSGAGKGAAT